MQDVLKEVYFDKYCVGCAHLGVPEELDPCYECLNEPANTESHKPVKFEAVEK